MLSGRRCAGDAGSRDAVVAADRGVRFRYRCGGPCRIHDADARERNGCAENHEGYDRRGANPASAVRHHGADFEGHSQTDGEISENDPGSTVS